MPAKLRRLRYWGPILLGCVCLAVSSYVPPFVAYVLVMAAFVLLFEAITAWFANTARTGSLKDYRQ